jgi:hypothetical protein
MQRRRRLSQVVNLAAVLLSLAGCTGSSKVTPSSAEEATFTPRPAQSPSPSLDPTSLPTVTLGLSPEADSTPTPTSCIGWTCTLDGVVYTRAANAGNELPGALVTLSHFSNCSPTQGKHETITGLDGTFEFEIYLHDTDTFWFEVEEEGYEPVRLTIGGFDCLFCSCPPVEIVLEP